MTLEAAISIIDRAFAMMAIPMMFAAVLLASRVKQATDDYFDRLAVVDGPQRPDKNQISGTG